jgi:hypothetical protein
MTITITAPNMPQRCTLDAVISATKVIAQGPPGPPGQSGNAGPPGLSGTPQAKNFSFGDASPLIVLSVPAALIVLQVNLVITTPFNGAGALLTLGTAAAPQSLVDTTQVNPALAAEYETNPNIVTSSNVLLTITPGAGCTQGAGWIVLQTATP